MDQPTGSTDAFTIERHGDLTLIAAMPTLETLDFGLEEQMATLVMAPLRRQPAPMVIFDLSAVDYFGSTFLAFLLRCWKLVQSKGGEMVLAGVSDRARELLRITALDMVWPMYGTRREAMEALSGD